MNNAVLSFGNADTHTNARSAVAPWLAILAELEPWIEEHAHAIWNAGGTQHAAAVVMLLRATLEAMARGEEAIARTRQAARGGAALPRIDALLAGRRPGRRAAPGVVAGQRRQAIMNLGLWHVLRQLQRETDGAATPLARLHAMLAVPLPPAPGVSPAPAYAGTESARRFFDGPVRRVLAALANRSESGANYVSVVPAQPFDAGLPALVAWSHAWSVAVAGVYLDNLGRHARGDLQQLLLDVWSGRLEAVRFRAGAGLTALPTRDGALHLDLWTCVVKAQALSFDAARWSAHAAGTPWHGVRIDMHELSGSARAESAARKRLPAATGLGVESIYRAAFIDRLQAVLGLHRPQAPQPARAPTQAAEHTIAIDLDRPRNGHDQNLRLLLRWREPSAGPLRLVSADSGLSRDARDALRRWQSSQAEEPVAFALDPERIDWRLAATPPPSVPAGAFDVLGHCSLWCALDAKVQWLDAMLVVRDGGAWYELPVVLHDELQGSEDAERTWWLLPASSRLPTGLDMAALSEALRAAAALRWVANEVGVGAFVMAAIDVDAWREAGPR